jgi:hypothetical protein
MNRQGAEDAKLREPDFEIDQIARVVVDAVLEVHRILGPGYLKASDRSFGLLINFNVCLLRQGVQRVIRSR